MQFFNFQGQSIHYHYLPGAGNRCFFLANSLGTDLRIWDEVAAQLQPHGSILRFDKPGHGLSESGPHCGIEAYGAIILALLEQHKVARCVFIGLSIGGLMGQYLALRHPQRIEMLVLSNTAACIGEQDYWTERIAQIEKGGTASRSRMILDRWLSPSFLQNKAAEVAGLRRMLESCDTPGYVQACQTLRDTDFTGAVYGINMPVLCIAGRLDAAVPASDMQALAASIPGAQIQIMEGIGHLPCIEAPEAYAAAILSFVLKHDAQTEIQ